MDELISPLGRGFEGSQTIQACPNLVLIMTQMDSNGFIECWNMIQAIPEAIFHGLWQASKLSDAAGRRQFLQETIQQCLQNVPWMVKSASDVAAIDEM